MSPLRLLALALALAGAAPTQADDVADARARYQEGVRLYRAGKYRPAIAAFEAAYRAKPHGAIHYNLAQCREKLGEWPAALRGYHDYLRELPEAKDRPAVLAAIRRLEEKLAPTGVQVLLVYSDPLGADVRIDGKARGTTPFHLVLPPGSYTVSIAREGYAAVAREVALGARGSQVVDVTLRPAPAQPLPPPPVANAPGTTVPPPDLAPRAPKAAAPTVPARPPAPVRAEPRGRVWTWVAAGVSAAALGTAVYYGLDAREKSDALLDGRPHADADALADGAKRSQRRANVLYGVAGAAGAAGAALFFVEGRF